MALLALARPELEKVAASAHMSGRGEGGDGGSLFTFACEALQRVGDGSVDVRQLEVALEEAVVGEAEAARARRESKVAIMEAAAQRAATGSARAPHPAIFLGWGKDGVAAVRTVAAAEGIKLLKVGSQVLKFGR